jgi:hypothetical protein
VGGAVSTALPKAPSSGETDKRPTTVGRSKRVPDADRLLQPRAPDATDVPNGAGFGEALKPERPTGRLPTRSATWCRSATCSGRGMHAG